MSLTPLEKELLIIKLLLMLQGCADCTDSESMRSEITRVIDECTKLTEASQKF